MNHPTSMFQVFGAYCKNFRPQSRRCLHTFSPRATPQVLPVAVARVVRGTWTPRGLVLPETNTNIIRGIFEVSDAIAIFVVGTLDSSFGSC